MSNKKRSVHVATITKRQMGKTYVTHLLRHTYRENGKVKQLTLGNLSDLPDDLIQIIRKRLSGQPLPDERDDFQIVRSLPHGHVAAVLGMLRKIGLDRLIASKPCREAQLVIATIVLRIIAPGSKLANLTSLHPETAEHSLADELQLEEIETPELYEALDWLLKRQTRIENKLAKKHLEEGTLVLYDVSSSYYTGRQSDLIRMGYSRDGKPGQPQIVYGLLCAPDGCPVAIEVFSIPEDQFTRRWAGFATAKLPIELKKTSPGKYYQFVERFGERQEEWDYKGFLSTSDREEVDALVADFPKRWHVEEFFKSNQSLGWKRGGTMNLNIRYGQMTMALIAQTAIHQLRQRLSEPYCKWDATHLAKDVFHGLEGDVRVTDDTILVTYYNAPEALCAHYEDLPEKLATENVEPTIPWLYNYQLDFRFR